MLLQDVMDICWKRDIAPDRSTQRDRGAGGRPKATRVFKILLRDTDPKETDGECLYDGKVLVAHQPLSLDWYPNREEVHRHRDELCHSHLCSSRSYRVPRRSLFAHIVDDSDGLG